MRRLRIAIASSGLGHVARGIEAWADDLGQALVNRGENVILCKGGGRPVKAFERVVPCWQRESSRSQALLKCMPAGLRWRIGLSNGYAVEQATFARGLVPTLRAEKIDILHVQDPLVAWYVQKLHARQSVKSCCVLAHGTEESLAFQAKITYLQHLAPWHMEQAGEQGVAKETWVAIPNFIDTDVFCPGGKSQLRRELNLPRDGLVILAAAAIKRTHKRIDYLAKEFRMLLDRYPTLPMTLVVAGGWESQSDELMAEATRLLGERVRFLVRYPRARMPELYRAADIFTLTSLKEMMPIALLEATSSGLPCVVNAHPVMQWMTGPGGVAADLSQTGAWADCVAPLLLDQPRRVELGRRAREHCLAQFSRDRVVDQIVDHYQWIMDYQSRGCQSEKLRKFRTVA